jgi:RPC5 protein
MVETVVEEDRVVREIDVYLSSSSSEYHLLQYPGHFAMPPPPQSVRCKPRHHLLEQEAVVHLYPARVYQSQTIPIQTHLCLGRWIVDAAAKESMQWMPLSHIAQMRPTFHHLMAQEEEEDDAYDDALAEDTDRMDGGAYRTRQESITDAAELVPSAATNITFQRKESDRAVAARKSSYAHQQASRESEPWMALHVVTTTADRPPTAWSPPDAAFPPRTNYLSTLNYIPTPQNAISPAGSSPDAVPYRHVVAQQLLPVLQHGGPVPFSMLRRAIPSDGSAPPEMPWDLWNVLAVVVRGNWYLHSKFWPGHRPSEPSDDARVQRRRRTFLLLLLHDYGRIDRSVLQTVVQAMTPPTSDRSLLALLRHVATPPSSTRGRHWVPQLADDPTWAQQYPSVARRHEAYWEKQRLRFAKELQLYAERVRD